MTRPNIPPGDKIIELLMKEDQFFKNETDEPWATFLSNGIKTHSRIDGEKYTKRITQLYYNAFHRGISESTLKSIRNTLKAYADLEGITKFTYQRVAGDYGNIYYDLANEQNEMVEISGQSVNIIKSNDSIIFNRHNYQKQQPYPEKGGALKNLKKYINIRAEDALLFTVYLVSCFIPDIQHPLLILHGESGQGKSTVSKIISELVDPHQGELFKIPEKDDDFYSLIDKHWLLSFDNISRISSTRSDQLCQLTTGITIARRILYTTDDVKLTTVKRCSVLNGIENVATKEDLLNRSIILEVKRKETKISLPENELMEEFYANKPLFLGAIFSVIQKALKIFPTIQLPNKNFRMAEFVKWGYAIAQAMGDRGDEFLEKYLENINKQDQEAVDANTLISGIAILMAESPKCEWQGRASDLLREVQRIAIEHGLNMRSFTMPESAPVLTKKLKAYNNLLKRQGIEFTHKHTRIGSNITLREIY